MGGTLSVTIIEENGNMHKMQRWTNPVPYFIENMKFFKKDQAHIQSYLNGWLPLKADWEKNGPDGPFEHEGTTDFFPSIGMSPAEYGILVIDFQKNKIYSTQNYASVNRIERLNREIDDEEDNWHEKNKNYAEFKEAGKILEEKDSSDQLFTRATIDVSPFELLMIEKNSANLEKMRDILNAEYGLSEEEVAEWQKQIDWAKSYEESVRLRKEEEKKEFWEQKDKLKRKIQKNRKKIVLEGAEHVKKAELLEEIAKEIGMNVIVLNLKEKEKTFNQLNQPVEENTIVFFENILFLDDGEEMEKIREFIHSLPDSCVAAISKRAYYEDEIINEITKEIA